MGSTRRRSRGTNGNAGITTTAGSLWAAEAERAPKAKPKTARRWQEGQVEAEVERAGTTTEPTTTADVAAAGGGGTDRHHEAHRQQVEVERPGTTAQQVTTAVGGSTRRCGAQGTEAIESQIICENRFYQPKDIKYEDMQLSAFKVCIEPD